MSPNVSGSFATTSCDPAGDRPPVQVFYCVYREGFSSIFNAQVLTPLSRHDDSIDVRLGLFAPLGHFVRRPWPERLRQLQQTAQQNYGVRTNLLMTPPTRLRRLWNDSSVLRRWLQRHARSGEPFVVHSRCVEMTNIALDACRAWPAARVVWDCRGDELAEHRQLHRLESERQTASTDETAGELIANRLQSMLDRAATESDHVTCVSHAMRDWLCDEHGLDPARATVVPCCSDFHNFDVTAEIRMKMRKKLGLKDKLVVTYCGSLAWYQLPQESLRLFKIIRGLDERNVKSMAAQMISLAHDQTLAADLGQAARQRIVACFSMKRSISRLWEVIESCIEGRMPRLDDTAGQEPANSRRFIKT